MYLYPELVDMTKAPNTPMMFDDKWPAIMKSVAYRDMTDSGTLGNAQVATAEKGKKAVELMLDEMEDCVKNYQMCIRDRHGGDFSAGGNLRLGGIL